MSGTLIEEPAVGPCDPWITGEDLADFCGLTDIGSDTALLDEFALATSEILFGLSGRQFNGECRSIVRPCRVGSTCWDGWGGAGWPFIGNLGWSWGWNGTYGAWSFGWYSGGDLVCGCRPLSSVKLAGYPVTSIVEILIDGVALDPFYGDGSPTYRLDGYRDLVRLDDPADPDVQKRWPSCQNLALPTTEEGTWSVEYTYGQSVPESGILAAKALGCQLWKSVRGENCSIPAGATKVTRQGITVDRALFLTWSRKDGSWATGIPLVDGFLQTFNPIGQRRRPSVWSPDVQQFPRHTGT